MTRQDYIAIAEALAPMEFNHKGNVVAALCGVFQMDNPKFNADRFITACYPNPKTRTTLAEYMGIDMATHPNATTYSVTVTGWLKVIADSMDDAERVAGWMTIADLHEYEILDMSENVRK